MNQPARITLVLLLAWTLQARSAILQASFEAADPARPGRVVPTLAVAPAVATAPCPLLIIGHATMTPADHYLDLAEPLAEAGWLVLIPDSEPGLPGDQPALAADMLCLVDMARDGAAPWPSELPPVSGDWALMGHSLGGGAAVLAAAESSPDALVLLAPQDRARPSMIALAGGVRAPTLLLTGELDCLTPPEQHHDPLHQALDAVPRAMVRLLGGGHCGFATPCEPCVGAELGCPSELSADVMQAITLGLARPWLDWHVRGENEAHGQLLAALSGPHVSSDLVEPVTAAPPLATTRLRLTSASVGAGVFSWRLDGESEVAEAMATVFDLRGRRIRSLSARSDGPSMAWRWDGRDGAGQGAPAGVYVMRVTMGRVVHSSRVVRVD